MGIANRLGLACLFPCLSSAPYLSFPATLPLSSAPVPARNQSTMKLLKLSEKSNNAAHSTVRDKLFEALGDLERGEGTISKANKVLIISLDNTNDMYNYSFYQAGMSMSECIALVEVIKDEFLDIMKK